MKAAVIREYGRPPVWADFPDPEPREGETLIRTVAAGVSNIARMRVAGTHYSAAGELPAVAGMDAVGRTEGGRRVYLGAPRQPYGTMAELVAVADRMLFPLPDELDDAIAAALPNPGVSAWLSLAHTGGLRPGQQVLVLGATGVTGRLAVQCARLLGAGRVVAAGRDPDSLARLTELGADATIRLGGSGDPAEAFAAAAGDGYDLVIDYLWGAPTEALIRSIARDDLDRSGKRTRLVQIGEMAGPRISLPAAALRSSALEVVGNGTGGLPSMTVLREAFQQVLGAAVRGDLVIDVETAPLSDVEQAWQRSLPGRRLVLVG